MQDSYRHLLQGQLLISQFDWNFTIVMGDFEIWVYHLLLAHTHLLLATRSITSPLKQELMTYCLSVHNSLGELKKHSL